MVKELSNCDGDIPQSIKLHKLSAKVSRLRTAYSEVTPLPSLHPQMHKTFNKTNRPNAKLKGLTYVMLSYVHD